MKDQAHAHNYPGRSIPAAEKVKVTVSHDHVEHKAGKENSLGASADGSHKGLAKGKMPVASKKEGNLGSVDHDGAELKGGKSNSLGASADGSHKGLEKR